MPSWSEMKAEFLNDSHPRQLGELASCLARIKAWCGEPKSARNAVPIIIAEGLFYLSLLMEIDGQTPEFTQLHQLLQDWQTRWSIIYPSPTEMTNISTISATWSDRILDMSGLLAKETENV